MKEMKWLALPMVLVWVSCNQGNFTSAEKNERQPTSKPSATPLPTLTQDVTPTPTPSPSDDHPSPTIDVSEIVATVPGIEVKKVGVNFEDRPSNGDGDFNDAVLCFTGAFKVDDTNVVSVSDQTVTVSTFSNAGCHDDITVAVVHDDGSSETPVTFDSKSTKKYTFKFKLKDKLEATMKSKSSECGAGIERSMHNKKECKVMLDQCNH